MCWNLSMFDYVCIVDVYTSNKQHVSPRGESISYYSKVGGDDASAWR